MVGGVGGVVCRVWQGRPGVVGRVWHGRLGVVGRVCHGRGVVARVLWHGRGVVVGVLSHGGLGRQRLVAVVVQVGVGGLAWKGWVAWCSRLHY